MPPAFRPRWEWRRRATSRSDCQPRGKLSASESPPPRPTRYRTFTFRGPPGVNVAQEAKMRTILAVLASSLTAVSMAHGAESSSRHATVWTEDAYSQTVFFAVLEGLYRDGVSTEVVELALAGDPATRQWDLFVYACPLCTP